MTIPERGRARLVRAAAFLALGSLLGVGAEMLLRWESVAPIAPGSLNATSAAPSEETTPGASDPIPPITPVGASPASAPVASAPASAPEEERAALPQHVHHHHTHRATPRADPSTGDVANTSAMADAGTDEDDITAATEALIRAKEEVTLP